jgi:hypothetical protein
LTYLILFEVSLTKGCMKTSDSTGIRHASL